MLYSCYPLHLSQTPYTLFVTELILFTSFSSCDLLRLACRGSLVSVYINSGILLFVSLTYYNVPAEDERG
jgi:hypothetical protein